MSDTIITRPEVLTGHTEILCSTSIRHVATVLNTTLQQTETLIRQQSEISALTANIDGKTVLNRSRKQGFRCGYWLIEKPETAMKAIICYHLGMQTFYYFLILHHNKQH